MTIYDWTNGFPAGPVTFNSGDCFVIKISVKTTTVNVDDIPFNILEWVYYQDNDISILSYTIVKYLNGILYFSDVIGTTNLFTIDGSFDYYDTLTVSGNPILDSRDYDTGDYYLQCCFNGTNWTSGLPTSTNPICYHGLSTILTQNRFTNITELILAKNLLSNEHDVYSITQKAFTPVKLNIVTGNASKFILIKKDTLGENKPDKDFYITPGHPIIIDGKEVPAEKISTGEKVLLDNQEVYSICTDNRESILVNNLPVLTWSYYAWMNLYINHHRFGWHDNQNTHQAPTLEITLMDLTTGNVKIEKDAFGKGNPLETVFVHDQQKVTINGESCVITQLMDGKWVKYI